MAIQFKRNVAVLSDIVSVQEADCHGVVKQTTRKGIRRWKKRLKPTPSGNGLEWVSIAHVKT